MNLSSAKFFAKCKLENQILFTINFYLYWSTNLFKMASVNTRMCKLEAMNLGLWTVTWRFYCILNTAGFEQNEPNAAAILDALSKG